MKLSDLNNRSKYKKLPNETRIRDETNENEEVNCYEEVSTGDGIEVFKDRKPLVWRRTSTDKKPSELFKFENE